MTHFSRTKYVDIFFEWEIFFRKSRENKTNPCREKLRIKWFFYQTNIISMHGPYAMLLYETMGLQLIALASSTKMVIPRAICKSTPCSKPHLMDTCVNLHRNWGKKISLDMIKISQIYTRPKKFQKHFFQIFF